MKSFLIRTYEVISATFEFFVELLFTKMPEDSLLEQDVLGVLHDNAKVQENKAQSTYDIFCALIQKSYIAPNRTQH